MTFYEKKTPISKIKFDYADSKFEKKEENCLILKIYNIIFFDINKHFNNSNFC